MSYNCICSLQAWKKEKKRNSVQLLSAIISIQSNYFSRKCFI